MPTRQEEFLVVGLFVLALILIIYVRNCSASREGYGPPPGSRRAVHHDELGPRGWADAPAAFEGNTVSSMKHYVEWQA